MGSFIAMDGTCLQRKYSTYSTLYSLPTVWGSAVASSALNSGVPALYP